MQPASPGAWLRAAAVALVIDVTACVTAWATWGDRAALLGVLAATLTATALACWLWSHLTHSLPLSRFWFALPFTIAIGALAAETATLTRWLGAFATLITIAAAATLTALAAFVVPSTRFKLPQHPLFDEGFASIGCQPCTRRVEAGEDARAGRWAGLDKTECGIHLDFQI